MSDLQTVQAQPVKRRKYKPRTKLTTSQWKVLRVAYELGEMPVKSLAETWGVSEGHVKHRATKEGWGIKKLAAEVHAAIERSTIEMFAAAGLPKEKLVTMFATDSEGVKTLKNVKVEAKDKDGKPIFDKDGFPVVIEKTVEVRDNTTTLETRKEVNRMCGNLAPIKEELEIRTTVMTIAVSLKAVILKVLDYVPDDKQQEIIAEFEKALQEPKQGEAQ